MLKPLRPRKSQDFLVKGLLWMMTGHPMGPMGVARGNVVLAKEIQGETCFG